MKCFVQKLQRHCHKFEHSIGDDINDLPAMELAGYVGYPADSSDDVKLIADYVSPISGGYGAVQDVVEHLLRKEGRWSEAISLMYGIGN